MSDKGKIEKLEEIRRFVKRKGYKKLYVEIFFGGEDNGEIFLEEKCIFSKSFEGLDPLLIFLKGIEIKSAYFGKSSIFLLSRMGLVYAIHGLSFDNFL